MTRLLGDNGGGAKNAASSNRERARGGTDRTDSPAKKRRLEIHLFATGLRKKPAQRGEWRG